MEFLCQKCSIDGVQATAHSCKTCTLSTYSAYALCVCCALAQDKCQCCETAMNSGRDDAAIKEVEAARAIYNAVEVASQAEFDTAIADIKSEIDAWLKVNKQSSEKYNATIKPFQDGLQTASETLRTLQSTGAKADSESMIAAKAAVDDANKALGEAVQPATQAMFGAINEERAKIGEEKLKRHEDAWRAKDKKIGQASRRLELVAERICGHLTVDKTYKAQLAELDKQSA